MKTEWETMSDAELSALPHDGLLAARDEVTACVIDIEQQLATRGREVKDQPGDAAGRQWLVAARHALGRKRAFLVRLKPLLRAAWRRDLAAGDGTRRRAVDVLADLSDALAGYAFDEPEDAPLRGLVAEAAALIALHRATAAGAAA